MEQYFKVVTIIIYFTSEFSFTEWIFNCPK